MFREWEITKTINKTFKEINSKHDMICIEQVKGIRLTSFCKYTEEQKGNEIEGIGKKVFSLWFYLDGMLCFESDNFDTEAEAIEFRNEIMEWENDK